MTELQQEFNKLLEDYKELKKENGYLMAINNVSKFTLITIPDKYSPEDVELDEEYFVPERVKDYVEDLYRVIEGMEREIESLNTEVEYLDDVLQTIGEMED